MTSLTEKTFIGEADTGKVYEQNIRLSFEREDIDVRQVIVELKNTTRNGDKELYIFTNLPKDKADALTMAHIYS